MFSRFGGAPDARVRAQLDRGRLLRSLLSQPQFAPLRLADEVALALALRDGALDGIAPEAVVGLRAALPGWLDQQLGAEVRTLQATGKMEAGQREVMSAALRPLAKIA
jgi:F-type H+/Na+-transporting ATPase subunit alpha